MKSVSRSLDLMPFSQITPISLAKNSKMAAEGKFLCSLRKTVGKSVTDSGYAHVTQ